MPEAEHAPPSVDRADPTMFDLAVIGGGINGCGIARDAAGRGLRVLLVERHDFGHATSSASTKLIHGGLRYLEHREFRLVREALGEREVLWKAAPHIIWPLRFVLPHHGGLRPAWMIRLGLFLYDHLGGRRLLPASHQLDLRRDPAGAALRPTFVRGFEYSDCWVEDSRLVLLNALDAAERGADVRPRTELTAADRQDGHWRLQLRAAASGQTSQLRSRILVNAGGPWVAEILNERLRQNSRANVRLVKGSHIVTRRLYDHDRAYIFQNADRRIVFAIPYEQDFTLIGTTDVDVSGDPPGAPAITADEVRYLCQAVSTYLARPVAPADVVWSYAGVRPLYDDGASAAQEATRDFVLDLSAPAGQAPLLSVFGGKITTFRRLAEAALARLSPWMTGARPAWTRDAALPGGDFPVDGVAALAAQVTRQVADLPQRHALRLVRAYGTRVSAVLGQARRLADLGRPLGAGLSEAELDYLVRHEWARTAEDVLWRRSKLGLHMTKAECEAVALALPGGDGPSWGPAAPRPGDGRHRHAGHPALG